MGHESLVIGEEAEKKEEIEDFLLTHAVVNVVMFHLERKTGNHETHEKSRKSTSFGYSYPHPSGAWADCHNSLLFRAFS
jgi:hypothetical protein